MLPIAGIFQRLVIAQNLLISPGNVGTTSSRWGRSAPCAPVAESVHRQRSFTRLAWMPQSRAVVPMLVRVLDPWLQPMALLILVALAWLSLRILLLLAQVDRHSPEARLGRAFQQELRERGQTVRLPAAEQPLP